MRLGMGLGLGNLLSGQPITGLANKYSFNFDGSNDYLEFGEISLTDFSISAWIYMDDLTTQTILGDGNNNNWVRVDGADSIKLKAGGTSTTFSPSLTFTTGEWQHICITRESNLTKVYRNGTVGTGTANNTGTFAPDRVGAKIGNSTFFDGLIDEVAIWDTALSASDVTSIYNNGKVIDLSKSASYGVDRTGNLKLWLRCGDKAEPESTTAIARQDFYSDFDGTDDHIVISDTDDLSFGDSSSDSPFSVTAWINADDITSLPILAKGTTSVREYLFGFSSLDKLAFGCYDNSDASISIVRAGATTLTSFEGSWIHVAGTYDGSGSENGIKLYINGASESTTSGSNGSYTAMHNLGDAVIGRTFNNGTNYADGSISNLAVYKTELDAQTISQMAKSRFTPMRDNRFSVVDFDGSNDVIAMTTSSAVSPTEAITVSAWVNFTSLENYDLVVGNTDTGTNGWRLAMDNANNIIFAINSWGSNHAETPMSATGVWHHLVGTYDKNNIKIYLNGELKGTDAYTDSITYSNNVFQIGGATGWSNLTGSISSVAVYNVAKSAEEVYAIYQQGITYDESSLSGLVGYWRMGDDTSKAYPTIADSSSNSNDGTITNGSIDDIVQQMVAGYDLGAFESSSEELNGEKVLNSDFSDGENSWTLNNANVVNEVLEIDEGAFSYYAQQAVDGDGSIYRQFESGNVMKVVIVVDEYTSGGTIIYATGNNIGTFNSAGTHTIYYKPSASEYIRLRSNGSGFEGKISSVSIKRVLQSEVSDTYPAIIDVNEPVLGTETLTYDFSDGTGVTVPSSLSVASGKTTFNGEMVVNGGDVSSDYYSIADNVAWDTSKVYKIVVVCSAYTSGSLTHQGGSASFGVTFGISSSIGGVGTFINYATPSSDGLITLRSQSFIGTLSSISIKEVFGNVGTMTNQDSADLVYSSVLPDQSFLGTGVNSAYNFIDLDGSNEYVDLNNDLESWVESPNKSFSIWVKNDGNTSTARIFNVGYSDPNNTGFGLGIDDGTDNKPFYFLRDTSADFLKAEFGDVLNTTDWYHFAIFVDGTANEAYIYQNGVLKVTVSNVGEPSQSTDQTAKIGKHFASDLGHYFNGKIGQVAIWNKDISNDVGSIYTLGRHGNLLDSYSDNLVGYWAMGALDAKTGLSDVGDDTIYDRSGNSNHGTPVSIASSDLKSSPNAEPNGYAKGDTNRSTTTP